MKFEETIQLENYAAHLHSILGNITIANSELEKVLEQKDRAIEDIESAENRLIELGNETKDLSSKRDQVVKETDGALKEVSDKTLELQKLQKDTTDFVGSATVELDKEMVELVRGLDRTELSLITLQEQKAVNEQSVAVLSKQVSGLSKDIADLSKETKKLRMDRDIITGEIESSSLVHVREVESRAKELTQIQVEIQKSRGKILDANAHFADRERSISRREKDVLVITRRLRELFQEVKPGIALKI